MTLFRFPARAASLTAFSIMAAGALCLTVGKPALAADTFNPAQKKEIETVVRSYLLENPEVLMEALNNYQAKAQENAGKAFKQKLGNYRDFLTSSSSPYAGNPKGDVTLIEFFDYNCGYCKHAVDDVNKLIEEDKNVKIIFKDYPILSESSNEASRYALASQKQGKYFEFHQKLMKYSGPKNEASYKEISDQLGLDFEKLKKDADSKEVREVIEKNISAAHNLGINGTPAFIFGDKLIPGYMGIDDMKQMVSAQREESKKK